MKITFNAAESKSLSTVAASVRSAACASRKADLVGIWTGITGARGALVSALADSIVRAVERRPGALEQPGTAVWNGEIIPALQAAFPATGALPSLSDARKPDAAKQDPACNLIRTLAQAVRNRIADKLPKQPKQAGSEKQEQITVRLTAPDRAALERDGSIVITVSAKRRVRIVLA